MITEETIKGLKLWTIADTNWYTFQRGDCFRLFYVTKKTAKSFTIREPHAYGQPETTFKLGTNKDRSLLMSTDIVPATVELIERYERTMLKGQWQGLRYRAERLPVDKFRTLVRNLERLLQEEKIT